MILVRKTLKGKRFINMKSDTNYMTYAARGDQTHLKKGVAIIIKEHLAQHITKETIDPLGHYISLTLEGFPGMGSHKLLISSVYMPTNIDRLSKDDTTYKLATNIHNKLTEQAKNHDTAIIGGDFNETRNKQLDRSNGTDAKSNAHPGRIIEHTIKEGLTDVYRNLHPTTAGHTHSQKIYWPPHQPHRALRQARTTRARQQHAWTTS